MGTFLEQQQLKNDMRRKKVMHRLFSRVQQISLIILIWSIGFAAIWGLYRLVFEKGIFVTKSVEVEGEFKNLSKDSVLSMAGIRQGENIFAVNLSKVQKQIAVNPWVREVAVARKLPSAIWVYVSEFEPYAIYAASDLFFVDKNGKLFKKMEGADDKNYPVITGARSDTELAKAIDVLDSFLNSALAEYFIPAEVNFSAANGYSIVLSNDGGVLRVGFDKVDEKLERLFSMLGAIQSHDGRIKYVDLNISGKVVVKYDS